jgi:hypothetical protein
MTTTTTSSATKLPDVPDCDYPDTHNMALVAMRLREILAISLKTIDPFAKWEERLQDTPNEPQAIADKLLNGRQYKSEVMRIFTGDILYIFNNEDLSRRIFALLVVIPSRGWSTDGWAPELDYLEYIRLPCWPVEWDDWIPAVRAIQREAIRRLREIEKEEIQKSLLEHRTNNQDDTTEFTEASPDDSSNSHKWHYRKSSSQPRNY